MDHAPAALARQLEQLCIHIGDRAADESGFVAIRELLDRFHVELIVRPLLVEGMVATIGGVGDEARGSRWAVLIDSDTHKLNQDDIRAECSARPLHSRARNTIAHELAHSIAFRPSQFGLQLTNTGSGKATELVRAIERETERLSPLLLVTEKALKRFQSSLPGYVSMDALMQFRERLGVSRDVFVSRLQMLRQNDPRGILEHTSFRNLALCIVEWSDSGSVIRNWPLFMNFDRNAVPDFLLRVRRQTYSRAIDLDIPAESILCGGPERGTTFECDVRVVDASKLERMSVIVEVEPRQRSRQTSVLLVRKAGSGV